MHVTQADALDGAKRIFTQMPVAGPLAAQPIRCDPRRGRITVAFSDATRVLQFHFIGSVRGAIIRLHAPAETRLTE